MVPAVVDDEVRLRRRHSFDEDPGNYDAARPDYPERVYEVLRERCGLAPGTRVLEVGPGTGQATRRLVGAGASVVAVELGAAMAGRLRAEMADRDVTVVEGDFATVELPRGAFDLAAFGTAFHWLDPGAAMPKLAALVRPGGWLAVWWTIFGDPQHRAAWRRHVDPLYAQYLPDERRDPHQVPRPMQVRARSAELAADGWFGPVQVEMVGWERRLNPDAAWRLWATFSNVRELPDDRREAFLDGIAEVVRREPGGSVVDYYTTVLYTAQRQIESRP